MVARIVIAAACCAGLVTGPASVAHAAVKRPAPVGAALTTAPAAPSGVTVVAAPARPVVGGSVRLAVTGMPPGATGFVWDLTGRGAYDRPTGRSAQVEARFASPGTHAVAVRFTAAGQSRSAMVTVDVAAAPAPPPAHHRATAHAAGDPGVTVADFHFSPSSTTIHVGDTITWTNDGPSSHTATARGGAFDTGVLKKGQSASHTFTRPGTFAYVCQIHPFMHGTIVVLAASTSSTPASTSTTPASATTAAATTATPTATTAAAPAGPTLPNTGFDLGTGLFAGLLLLGGGIALRRAGAR